jgi:hypothetical protein
MLKHHRECLQQAKEMLEPAGFEIWTEQTGRLTKLKLCAKRGRQFASKTLCSTPRSDKADLGKTQSWARKLLRM